MTRKEVKTMLAGVGIPTAYYEFPKNTGQQPPFLCFFYTGSDDFYADNSNYSKIRELRIELYTSKQNFSLEDTVERILQENGLTYAVDYVQLDEERMFEAVYTVEILITG